MKPSAPRRPPLPKREAVMFRKCCDNFEEYACVLLCGVMIACLLIQVGLRLITGSALAWTEELSRFCFIWTVYLGMSLATKRLAHVRISAQFAKAPLRVRLVFRILADLFCVVFNLLIAWYCFEVIRDSYRFPEFSPTLGIVRADVELIVPASFLLSTWRVIEDYIRRLRAGSLAELAGSSQGAEGIAAAEIAE